MNIVPGSFRSSASGSGSSIPSRSGSGSGSPTQSSTALAMAQAVAIVDSPEELDSFPAEGTPSRGHNPRSSPGGTGGDTISPMQQMNRKVLRQFASPSPDAGKGARPKRNLTMM